MAQPDKNVLVVAAHPDDEVLGCGGTIARHSAEGHAVHVLIMAEGATARHEKRNAANPAVALLEEAARRAAGILGAHEPRFAGFPDNRMDEAALLDVIKVVEATIAEIDPAVVYTHHGGDLNKDHRIVHEAVITACRPLPGAAVIRLCCFETPSSTAWASAAMDTGFRPNRFVNIDAQLGTKLAALDCYQAEMRTFPHPRSREAVTALARIRGATAGLSAAEAFVTIREIID